jgi:RNA 3'-terminal phosphate cyclase (ATP)
LVEHSQLPPCRSAVIQTSQHAGIAIQQASRYLAANVPVGDFLADQLLIPLPLAGSGSFVTQPLTPHTRTNIDVITRFLPARIAMNEMGRDSWRLDVIES